MCTPRRGQPGVSEIGGFIETSDADQRACAQVVRGMKKLPAMFLWQPLGVADSRSARGGFERAGRSRGSYDHIGERSVN
jgi:hypothetical protein